MYGEYAHVLENVVECQVDRLQLKKLDNYRIKTEELISIQKNNYDWVIIVNPNSPTGQYLNSEDLKSVIQIAPENTRFWIDETYLEFADPDNSLEQFAATSDNVIVCKSMSKVYALSGVRAAYLCGPAFLIEELRHLSPPWAVSLPGQIAACEALRNVEYYTKKWKETRILRENLSRELQNFGWEIIPGCANFLLCQLPEIQPDACALIAECKKHNLYLRDVGNMGNCFDKRTLRIAVKNSQTNTEMIRILNMVLSEIERHPSRI